MKKKTLRLTLSDLRIKYEGERYRRKIAEARIADLFSQVAILKSKKDEIHQQFEELRDNSLLIIQSDGIPMNAAPN